MKESMRPFSLYLTAWNRLVSTWMSSRCGASRRCAAARPLSMTSLLDGAYSIGCTNGSDVLSKTRDVKLSFRDCKG